MDRSSSALVRLVDLASSGAAPLARRLAALARGSAQHVAERILGADFDERVETVRARYEQLGGDLFGLDAETVRSTAKVCAFFHRVYFRSEIHGIDNVPDGRVLLVSNHSGQIPVDAAVIACAMLLDAARPRIMRAMVDRWAATLPFISTFFARVGQVSGVPENAERLLDRGEALLVFPEGIRGISKPFGQRYQLQPFTHGFVRLALRTDTPIVPVAVLGAEEQYVSIGNLPRVARALGIPAFPIIPQLLVPGGQLPLPTRFRVHFGEPMRLSGSAEDDAAVAEQAWLVRQAVHDGIMRGLAERRAVFW
jgi:1-acyl-sn-glycerol-3-phosphate acyltransferase